MKLAHKLIFVITLLALVAVVVAAASVYTTSRSALQTQISRNQQEVAVQTMDKIDRFLYERRGDVQTLAQRDPLRQYLAGTGSPRVTAAQATAALVAFRDISDVWTRLRLVDARAATRASTDDHLLTLGLTKEDASLQVAYREAMEGQVVASDVVRDPHNGEIKMTFMAPVKDGGRIVGAVVADLQWGAVQEILRAISGPTAYLLSKDGVVIGGNPGDIDSKLIVTSFGSTAAFDFVRKNQKGSAVLADFKQSNTQTVSSFVNQSGFLTHRGHGWYLVLNTPTSVAYGPAQNQALYLIFMYLLIVAGLMAAITVLLNRVVLRPVRAISAAVNRVTFGDLTQKINVKSKDELGVLSHNFNEMTRQLVGSYRSLEDATQAAREGRAQLESSINGLRQGFVLTDANGKVVLANVAARYILRDARSKTEKSPHDLELSAIAKALPPDLNLEEKVKFTLHQHEAAKFPDISLQGRFLNLYLSPVMSDNNNAIGCVLLFEDMTEERILQRSRDEFFSIASHELRTPLTAIRGNTALIQQYFPEVLKDPSMKGMISDIHESSVRLIEIVNDFLDASRLEQDKMKFTMEAFAVDKVIEKVIYEMAGTSRDKGLYLKFDQHTLGKIPLVYADANRVKQIVYNLVGNAMKFTEKGGVAISCSVEGKKLKVSVSDTGPGISTEGQQILFHKFQQATSSTLTRDNTRGTGLGLYISRLLLERMDGEIQLDHSELGHGTTFSFTVPIATDAQVQEAAAKAAQLAAAANPVADAAAPQPVAEALAAPPPKATTKAKPAAKKTDRPKTK